jgi:heme/copper-type cytochrome/quinol oxidase subunit 3
MCKNLPAIVRGTPLLEPSALLFRAFFWLPLLHKEAKRGTVSLGLVYFLLVDIHILHISNHNIWVLLFYLLSSSNLEAKISVFEFASASALG